MYNSKDLYLLAFFHQIGFSQSKLTEIFFENATPIDTIVKKLQNKQLESFHF